MQQRVPELDIVVPVFNEGELISSLLDSLHRDVKTPWRLLICYDLERDDTLPAIERYPHRKDLDIEFVKNPGRGPNSAVLAGFRAARAPAVLTYTADDDYNAVIIDRMVKMIREGHDVVTGSRFIPGGTFEGCAWLKAVLSRIASITLYHLARHPIHDATNCLRMFSRRLLEDVSIESTEGFIFALELAVKAHRLGWKVGEVPAQWHERRSGKSRFQIAKWFGPYLRWYFYAFATTWLGRGPKTVPRREATKALA